MSGKYRNPNYKRDWGNCLWKCPICHHKIKQKSKWCHQKNHCFIVQIFKYVQEIKEILTQKKEVEGALGSATG